MSQPSGSNELYALASPFTQGLARQLQEIELAGTLARQGLHEIRTAHCYATDTIYRTLQSAEQVILTARQNQGLSPLQEAALYHYTQAYLYEMLLLADKTGAAIVAELIHA